MSPSLIKHTQERLILKLLCLLNYRKVPVLSPGLIFIQNAFLLGLFSGELIFGRDYYWKEFCVSKWVGLDNENTMVTA